MRRWFALLLAVLLTVCLFGCQPSVPPTEPETSATQPTVQTEPPAQLPAVEKPLCSVSVPAIRQEKYSDDGELRFVYIYPGMSLVVQDADVADKVILEFLNRLNSAQDMADDILNMVENGEINPYVDFPYLCRVLYDPARIDSGVLSLEGTITTYMGGVHPSTYKVSASYDLVTGDVLTLGSIMHMDATTDDFCRLVMEDLDANAEELGLFGDYPDAVAKRFAREESLDEDFYFTDTGLCFYFSPYEIAPYASGIITVEIPYEKLAGLINDAYFPAEKHFTDGVITCKPFTDEDAEQVGQISEAILTPGTQMYLLTASQQVESVKLTYTPTDPVFRTYTFFAAESLSASNAIMIQATPEEMENMQLTYTNAQGVQTVQLP